MASTSNSADIGIRVFLQDSASSSLSALDARLGKLGLTAKASGALFGEMSARLASLAVVAGLAASFLGFGGAIVYSAQQAMDLQQALTTVALATNASKEEMDQLQPLLLNLGANSIFSLQQLADGIAVVGQYGFKTTQQIKEMSQAGVNLAEATNTDTVSAFKLLAVTMQAFNIPASQANDTAALLFYSIEHGTPNISNLSSALGQLGGVATSLHLGLQDIIPALDTISVGMGSASTAAAGLRYFLVNIVHPTQAAATEMKKLGLSAFDAQGNFVGLQPLLQDLSSKISGLSDAAKSDILGTLFNIRSGTAIKQLLDQIKQYEHGISDVNNQSKLKAQLDAAASKVMGQLGSVIHVVTSNLQDFAALVGTAVVPELLGFLNSAVVPLVTHLRGWAQDPSNQQLVANFLLLGAAISGVGLIIVGTFMSPIVAFMAIMLSVMAIVAGAAAGIIALKTHWAQLAPVVERAKQVISVFGIALGIAGGIIAGIKFAQLINGFMDIAPGLLTVIQLLGQFGVALAVNAGQWVVYGVKNLGFLIAYVWDSVPAIMASAGAWLASAAAEMLALAPYILLIAIIAGAVVGLVLIVQHLGFLNTILALAKAAWAAILPALQQAGNEIRGAFLSAIKQLQPVWQQLVQAFHQAEPALIVMGKVLGVVLVVAIGVLLGIIRGLINVFVAVVTTIIHVAAGIIQAFAGVIQFFSGFFTFIHGLFTLNGAEILAGLKTMGLGILNIFKGLWNAVSSVFIGAFNAIKGFVTGFIQGIIGFFQHLFNTLVGHSIVPDMMGQIFGAFLGLGPRVLGAVGNLIGNVIGHFRSLPGDILHALGNLGGLLFGAGQAVVNGFLNGIKSIWNSITNFVSNGLNNIRNLFPHSPAKEGPLVDAHLWMPNLVHMLADTGEKAAPSLYASMSRVAGVAKSGLASPAGGGSGGGTSGGATYTFVVDGKAFMSFFHNQITGQLQANGVGRMLK